MKFRFKPVKTIPEMIDAIRLRIKVFHKEQKVNPLTDLDKYDKDAHHFIALNGKNIIGTSRVRILNNWAKIERMAIDKNYRDKGVGKGLAQFIINFFRRKEVPKIYLNAQYLVMGFYEKLGFKAVGKPFYEAKIKHIRMVYNDA
jgi:predicted GNAT family N-acyltransferase